MAGFVSVLQRYSLLSFSIGWLGCHLLLCRELSGGPALGEQEDFWNVVPLQDMKSCFPRKF